MSTRKILGQAAPATASTEVVLYTCPSTSADTVVSTILVCNRGSNQNTFRISTSKAGAATSSTDYLTYDLPIAGNDVFAMTAGFTLAPTDVVRVNTTGSGSALLTYQIFGQEN